MLPEYKAAHESISDDFVASSGGAAVDLLLFGLNLDALMLLYVDDVDGTFQKAIAAGAQALKPVEDQFYGDRSGTLSDPFGHMWTIATHKEDVSPEEMKRRASEKFSKT